MHETFLSLNGYQWLCLTTAILTLCLLLDALAGHYRRGFNRFFSQIFPFVTGIPLILCSLTAAIFPNLQTITAILGFVGIANVLTGLIGFFMHLTFGFLFRPGGHRWWLHHLMYGAPLLAPLALSSLGMLGYLSASIAQKLQIPGFSLSRDALLIFVSFSLAATLIQTFFLHYRGAFNSRFMYLPFSIPVIASCCSFLSIVFRNQTFLTTLSWTFWITFFTGFAGLGFHLRGLERMMGGLDVALANWLAGPPAFVPAFYSGYAAIGLIALHLI